MWCSIRGIEHVKNVDILQGVKEETNVLYTVQRNKAKWIGITLHRKCLLTHVLKERKRTKNEEEEVSNYWMTLTL
jgi:hypothetical protein